MNIPVIKEPILYVDCDDTLVSWEHFADMNGRNIEEFVEFMPDRIRRDLR